MITKDSLINKIVEKNPRTEEIFFKYGMHCVKCHMAMEESLEQGALAHGLDHEEIDKLIKELNKSL